MSQIPHREMHIAAHNVAYHRQTARWNWTHSRFIVDVSTYQTPALRADTLHLVTHPDANIQQLVLQYNSSSLVHIASFIESLYPSDQNTPPTTTSPLPQLETVTISCQSISAVIAVDQFTHIPRLYAALIRLIVNTPLKHLSLNTVNFLDFRHVPIDLMRHFFRACLTKLRTLYLGAIVVTPTAAHHLASEISNATAARQRTLDNIAFYHAAFLDDDNDDDIHAIYHAITNVRRQSAATLAIMAPKLVTFKTLNFQSCGLNDECVDVLADALRKSERCEMLHLNDNREITNAGARQLVQLLDDAVQWNLTSADWEHFQQRIGIVAMRLIARFTSPSVSRLQAITLSGTAVSLALLYNVNAALARLQAKLHGAMAP